MVCKKHVRCRCMVMKWLMQNAMHEYGKWQMHERYVHYDAMKRCLCGAWYECIYRHERPKNHIFLLAHLGAQCPMCIVKKVIWTFQLLVTKDETNIQCMRDDMIQMRNNATRGCTQHAISSNNHIAKAHISKTLHAVLRTTKHVGHILMCDFACDYVWIFS